MRAWLAQVSLLGATLQGRVSPWELPALAAEHGFDGVEWLDRLLPSFAPHDLARLGEACGQAGLGPGGLSLSLQHQAPRRTLALQLRRSLGLIEACPSLGVEYVRVALGGRGLCLNGLLESLSSLRPPKQQLATPLGALGRTAYRLALNWGGLNQGRGHGQEPPPARAKEHKLAQRALEPLARRAAELGLRLGVENHWGLSGRPADLRNLVYNLGNYNVGICLDLDNWYEDQEPLNSVAILAGRANHVHYKARAENPAQEALELNYEARLDILKKQGYAGAFSVEYEGPEPALPGAVRTLDVLRALWSGPA